VKFCWAKYCVWICITLFGMASLLTACGQKGPLYLPDNPKDTKEAKKDQKKDNDKDNKKK